MLHTFCSYKKFLKFIVINLYKHFSFHLLYSRYIMQIAFINVLWSPNRWWISILFIGKVIQGRSEVAERPCMTFQGRSATSERPCMIFQKKKKSWKRDRIQKRFSQNCITYNGLLKRGVFFNKLFIFDIYKRLLTNFNLLLLANEATLD